ncbi:MAG: transposase [bacterium]|nr:transposase [bacterium]
MRKTLFEEGEYYHIYNRGVDKRTIFLDEYDYSRFLQGMDEFNSVEPIGSIYENSFIKQSTQLGHRVSKLGKNKKLVNFIAYCINPNHYHFILEQIAEKGIEKFMQRIGMGYAKYFNNKYKRTGTLFQGKFKAIHINSNEYLLHLSAYVNLNNRVHRLGHRVSKSSWEEYIKKKKNNFCKKSIILNQFNNISEYKNLAENSLKDILERKQLHKELEISLLE